MQADGDFKRALELQPNFVWTHYWRRTSLMKQGQYTLVTTSFTAALVLDPGMAEACGNRALAPLVPGREREALTDLKRCLELKRNRKRGLNNGQSKWNSRSARVWFMPNSNWAFQIIHGFLRTPENEEPDVDIRRTTASVQYNKPFHRGNWASAFIWGRNHISERGETRNLNGYTAESTAQFLDKNFIYTRLELVDKDELLRSTDRLRLGITQDHPCFRIGAYTFGGVRDVWTTEKVELGIGGDLTFYSKPPILDAIYGNNPVSWKLFLRLRPGKMDMTMHSLHGTHGSANKPSR